MAGEKTEKATPKKRRDSRKEGNVLQSREITTAVSLLGTFVAMSIFAQFMFVQMESSMRDWIARMGEDFTVNGEFLASNALNIMTSCLLIIGPLLLFAVVLGILPTIVQTRGLFTMKPLRPKFSKLNPLTGIKRMFSLQSVISIVKAIIEIAAIVIIVYNQILGLMDTVANLPDMDLIQGVVFVADSIFSIIMIIAVIFVFVAAGDYLYQWWEFERKLRMSKQEIKDEYKNTEGDPQIKSKIKAKQREIAQKRMMEEVPQSDVVVRNPTHFAVALKYDPANMIAPQVVAKGKDEIALRIIAIAEESHVAVTTNRPLARTLFETVELGKFIPAQLFTAVATILSELDKFKHFGEGAGSGSGAGNQGAGNQVSRRPRRNNNLIP
jgi:flagellar biosynthetic protein FlhB